MRRWQVRPDDNGTRVPSLVILPLVARILFAFALMAPILSWSLSLSLSPCECACDRYVCLACVLACYAQSLVQRVSLLLFTPLPRPRAGQRGQASKESRVHRRYFFPFTHSRELPKHVSKHTDLFLVLSLVCSCCCCCVQPFTWAILRSLLRHEPTHSEMNEASLLALLILPEG